MLTRTDLSFKSLNQRLGKLTLDEFQRKHLHIFVQKRLAEVTPSTVNKDIAALRKMFSFAVEVAAVDRHPLVRFPMVKVQETARRILTVSEFHALVGAMDREVWALARFGRFSRFWHILETFSHTKSHTVFNRTACRSRSAPTWQSGRR